MRAAPRGLVLALHALVVALMGGRSGSRCSSQLRVAPWALLFALPVVACSIGPSDGSLESTAGETALGEADSVSSAARRTGTCSVAPSPVLIGEGYIISAAGLPASRVVRVEVVEGGQTSTTDVTTDAAGALSLAGTAQNAGSGRVSILEVGGRRLRALARCGYEVQAPCTPATCEAAGASCGEISDGCGGVLACGDCTAPETCGGGGTANVCGGGTCQPTTCQEQGKNCGEISNGCGGVLACGTCTAPETCGGGGTANVCGGGSSLDWPAEWSAFEDQVLVLLNQRRAAGATCGTTPYPPAGPLASEAHARDAARLHSKDMATNNYFSHTGLDGRSFLTRMQDAGWAGACPCGENIAAGYSTPEAVVSGWMNSPGHCSNIMSAGYGVVGVGYAYGAGSSYGRYWTLDFAAR